jgi:hypothetical protein
VTQKWGKVAQKWGKNDANYTSLITNDNHSKECKHMVFPRFSACYQLLSDKLVYTSHGEKPPKKRKKRGLSANIAGQRYVSTLYGG